MAKKPKKPKKQPKPFFSASDDVGYGIGPTDLLKNPTKAELKQAEEYQDAKADFIEGLDYKLPDKEDDSAKAFLEKLRPGDITPAGTWVLSKETLGKLDPIYEGIPDFLKLNQQESIYERREALKNAYDDGFLDETEFDAVMHNIDIEEANFYTGPRATDGVNTWEPGPIQVSPAPTVQQEMSHILDNMLTPRGVPFYDLEEEEEEEED